MGSAEDPTGQDPDKGQISSLFARAASALEEVRQAVVRSSQMGKIKMDATFLRRERDQLLRELGAGVYALVKAGSFALPEALAPTIARIGELEEGLAEQERELAEVEAEKKEAATPGDASAPGKEGGGEAGEVATPGAEGEARPAESSQQTEAHAGVGPAQGPRGGDEQQQEPSE